MKCLKSVQIYLHHSNNIEFGVQNWLPLSWNNHNNTKHLEIIYKVLMRFSICWDSGVSLRYVHMGDEILDFAFLECRNLCENQQYMSLS